MALRLPLSTSHASPTLPRALICSGLSAVSSLSRLALSQCRVSWGIGLLGSATPWLPESPFSSCRQASEGAEARSLASRVSPQLPGPVRVPVGLQVFMRSSLPLQSRSYCVPKAIRLKPRAQLTFCPHFLKMSFVLEAPERLLVHRPQGRRLTRPPARAARPPRTVTRARSHDATPVALCNTSLLFDDVLGSHFPLELWFKA